MKKIIVLILLVVTTWTAEVSAQVKIGGTSSGIQPSIPQTGISLDLSTSGAAYAGGMLLPNITIDDLRYIPVSMTDFASKTEAERDVVASLAGSMAYHIGGGLNNYPAGVYIWDGDNWMKPECCPVCFSPTNVYIYPRPEEVIAPDPTNPVLFTASHNGSEEGTIYTWYVLNCVELSDFLNNGTLPAQYEQKGASNTFAFNALLYMDKITSCNIAELTASSSEAAKKTKFSNKINDNIHRQSQKRVGKSMLRSTINHDQYNYYEGDLLILVFAENNCGSEYTGSFVTLTNSLQSLDCVTTSSAPVYLPVDGSGLLTNTNLWNILSPLPYTGYLSPSFYELVGKDETTGLIIYGSYNYDYPGTVYLELDASSASSFQFQPGTDYTVPISIGGQQCSILFRTVSSEDCPDLSEASVAIHSTPPYDQYNEIYLDDPAQTVTFTADLSESNTGTGLTYTWYVLDDNSGKILKRQSGTSDTFIFNVSDYLSYSIQGAYTIYVDVNNCSQNNIQSNYVYIYMNCLPDPANVSIKMDGEEIPVVQRPIPNLVKVTSSSATERMAYLSSTDPVTFEAANLSNVNNSGYKWYVLKNETELYNYTNNGQLPATPANTTSTFVFNPTTYPTIPGPDEGSQAYPIVLRVSTDCGSSDVLIAAILPSPATINCEDLTWNDGTFPIYLTEDGAFVEPIDYYDVKYCGLGLYSYPGNDPSFTVSPIPVVDNLSLVPTEYRYDKTTKRTTVYFCLQGTAGSDYIQHLKDNEDSETVYITAEINGLTCEQSMVWISLVPNNSGTITVDDCPVFDGEGEEVTTLYVDQDGNLTPRYNENGYNIWYFLDLNTDPDFNYNNLPDQVFGYEVDETGTKIENGLKFTGKVYGYYPYHYISFWLIGNPSKTSGQVRMKWDVFGKNDCDPVVFNIESQPLLETELECPSPEEVTFPVYVDENGTLLIPPGESSNYYNSFSRINYNTSSSITYNNDVLGSSSGLSVKIKGSGMLRNSGGFGVQLSGTVELQNIPADGVIAIPVDIFGNHYTFKFNIQEISGGDFNNALTFDIPSSANVYVNAEGNITPTIQYSNTTYIIPLPYSGAFPGTRLTFESQPVNGLQLLMENGIQLDQETGSIYLYIEQLSSSNPGTYAIPYTLMGESGNLTVNVINDNVIGAMRLDNPEINIYINSSGTPYSGMLPYYPNISFNNPVSNIPITSSDRITSNTKNGLTLDNSTETILSGKVGTATPLVLSGTPAGVGKNVFDFTFFQRNFSLTVNVIQSVVSNAYFGGVGWYYKLSDLRQNGYLTDLGLNMPVTVHYSGFDGSNGAYTVNSDEVNGLKIVGTGTISDENGTIELHVTGTPSSMGNCTIPVTIFGRTIYYSFNLTCFNVDQ